MRVAVVGSRSFRSISAVYACVLSLFMKYGHDLVIVSGGCPDSTDVWAEEAAIVLDLETIIHLADWETHGKAAGFIRNADIARDADFVVAFFNQEAFQNIVTKNKGGAWDTVKKAAKMGKSIDMRIR